MTARIRWQQGTWVLYWPEVTAWTMCPGCERCADLLHPSCIRKRNKGIQTGHDSKGAAARWARQRGMGPLMLED